MKKLLLLATLLLALGFQANAAKYEFKMSDVYSGKTFSDVTTWGPFELSFDGGGNSNKPTYNTGSEDFRSYGKNTITIKSTTTEIISISFLISNQGKKQFSKITPSVGSIVKQGVSPLEWEGNDKEVTFTVGNANDYGTATSKNAGQFDFTNVIITTSEEGVAVKSPEFSVVSGDVKKGTQVEITCPTADASIYYTTDGEDPTNASTLYDGAITINETMTIKAIAYKGADKSELAVASYTALPEFSSIEDLVKLEEGDEFFYNGELIAVYANGTNNYVYDGKKFTLLYSYGTGWNPGDILKGEWKGEIDFYNGLFEVKPSTLPTVDGNTDIPTPVEITAVNMSTVFVASNMNMYALFKNVTIEEETPGSDKQGAALNFSAKANDETIAMRNNFKLAAQDPGTYDVLGFIAQFNGAVQFYPISYTEVKTDGIEGVEVDANAPVVYYNLSGMRISNPAEGDVVIRVQGGKATKVRF
ncbi:MAG: chitobiase/beta-hexosaminidase C-terminal domain-containing protein [Muribaculum sp.]|nr:chitobiase/beta-hexosaminidase C-terminal domain-containing protein [Muribaculum sp.]